MPLSLPSKKNKCQKNIVFLMQEYQLQKYLQDVILMTLLVLLAEAKPLYLNNFNILPILCITSFRYVDVNDILEFFRNLNL